jgi:hypothetical protein
MDDDGLDYGQMRGFLLALASFMDTHFPATVPMRSGIERGIQGMESVLGRKHN